jgi:replicative DNA helicase
VGARPSVGKSAFCLQVAVNVAKRGRKVLFLPLEMSAAETMDRIVMRYVDQSVVKYRDIHRGRLSVDQTAEVTKVVNQIDTLSDSFLIYENVRDIEQIKTLIQNEHPDLIVIDQLSQIRNGNDQQTVRERYVEVTRTLKAIALEENVAIWLPCQMNRESSKSGMVSIDYLKESGSIEEDADIVLILSNKKDKDGNYEANDAGRKVKLEVAKNRQGRCASEELIFIGPRFTFLSQTAEWVETTGYEQQF